MALINFSLLGSTVASETGVGSIISSPASNCKDNVPSNDTFDINASQFHRGISASTACNITMTFAESHTITEIGSLRGLEITGTDGSWTEWLDYNNGSWIQAAVRSGGLGANGFSHSYFKVNGTFSNVIAVRTRTVCSSSGKSSRCRINEMRGFGEDSVSETATPPAQAGILSVVAPTFEFINNPTILISTQTASLFVNAPVARVDEFNPVLPTPLSLSVLAPTIKIKGTPSTIEANLSVLAPVIVITVFPANIGIVVDEVQPPFDFLYCWSEPTIKIQGNFSLGCQANEGSIGETLTHNFDGRVL